MSGALLNLGGPKFPEFLSGRIFNASGGAGPRRLMILTITALAVLALVVVVAMTGRNVPANSHDARMKHVDPLPGGLYSTPEQDALARKADGARAHSSLEKGVSFTPPMAPSVPVLPAPPQVEKAAPQDTARPRPVFAGRPGPAPRPVPVRVAFPAAIAPDPPAAARLEPQAQPIRVAAAGDPKAEEAYSKRIGDLFSQWGGRTPHTDIVLPPSEEDGAGASGDGAEGRAPAGASSRKAPPPEAGVASDVDQHYLARFILPAAAAFVQGLGQAIATTSNTAAVLSPLGGAAYSTHLNLNQQLGVAAGAAAGQVGAVLNQAAPKGPTVSLDANVAVGVMFLSNVTMHRGP
jgi:hypothetical protein